MKYTVVVADDEMLIAKNVAKMIEQTNPAFEVTAVCSCGTEAWEHIQENPPHLVFTDINMPEMDGLELAQKISENYSFIPCVILSGYNDFEYAKKAIKYNVKNYLLKPVNRGELEQCLSEIEKLIQARFPNLENVGQREGDMMSPEEIAGLVEEHIKQNYRDPIDLSSIARNFGFSPAYLTKIFTKHTGTSPSKYIKDYRISVAKQLLASPDLPMSYISEQTGFADPFHFSKSFKAATGLSPSEYRAKNDTST